MTVKYVLVVNGKDSETAEKLDSLIPQAKHINFGGDLATIVKMVAGTRKLVWPRLGDDTGAESTQEG